MPLLLSQKCSENHFETCQHLCVPDDHTSILNGLEYCSQISNTIFITGGLGPTTDDFTRNSAALFFNKSLIFNEASYLKIKERCQTLELN